MNRRLGIFKRILLSYLIITIIPFAILAVVLISNTNESYAHSVVQKTKMELKGAQSILDVRITEILTMAYQMSENIGLFSDGASPYMQYENVEKIKQMCVGNQFVKNIALWHDKKDNVYTSVGVMSKSTYMDQVFKMEEWEYKLQSSNSYFFVSNRTGKVVCAVPCRKGKGNEVIALFLFDEQDVFPLLWSDRLELQQHVLLIDNNEQIICHTMTDGIDPQIIVDQERVNIKDKTYRIIRADSSSCLKLTVLVPEESLTTPFGQIRVMLVMAIMMLAGSVGLAIWLATIQFKPVFELGKILTNEESFYRNWQELHQDVYETIRKNKEYIETIVEQRRQLLEHNLIRLLYGEINNVEKINETATEIKLKEDVYCCTACVRIGETPHSVGWLHAMQLLEQNRTQDEILLEMEHENVIAIIFLYSELTNLQRVTERCRVLLSNIRVGEKIHVGVGSVEYGLENLRNSWLQALATLEFVTQKYCEQNQIVCFNEIIVNQESIPNLKEKEIFINLALRRGDEQLAKETIHSLMLLCDNVSCAKLHYVCYSLQEIIVPIVMEEFGTEKAEQLRCSMTAEINAGYPEGFRCAAEKAIAEICAKRNEQSKQNWDRQKRELLAFIHEKYTDSSMSLEYLAEKFGFSNFYWSRYFKEVVGQNFNDYVWTLRLERAKQLLVTTMPLVEVVEHVGYIDVRSFTRRFKNAMGVTPTQYRKEQEANRKPPEE